MEKDVAIPQRLCDYAGMVQYHSMRFPKGFQYHPCHQSVGWRVLPMSLRSLAYIAQDPWLPQCCSEPSLVLCSLQKAFSAIPRLLLS